MTSLYQISVDGPRFAAALKAVTTTIGKQATDPDTHATMWVALWEDHGLELACYDGVRVAVAYVPQVPGTIRPTFDPDYRATIRLSATFRGRRQTAGRTSDQFILLEPWQTAGHLPGLEPPPGIKLTLDGTEEIGVTSTYGIETAYHGTDWRANIADTTPATSPAVMVGSAETFKAVAAIAGVVGPVDIGQRLKAGGDVVVLTPSADADVLGFDFVSLMSWRSAA